MLLVHFLVSHYLCFAVSVAKTPGSMFKSEKKHKLKNMKTAN